MRLVLAVTAALLAGCSGLPPDTLLPLSRGDIAVGVHVGTDLTALKRPDVSMWVGAGLGRGVDVGVGIDAILGLLAGGPDAFGLFAMQPPGLVVRKTWPSGVGVGIGTSTRLDFSRHDSLGPGSVSTAGALVTVGPRPGSWDGGPLSAARATAFVGLAAARTEFGRGSPATRGLAVLGSIQAGRYVADDDTVGVFAGGRVQTGVLVFSRRVRLDGPTLGAFVQTVTLPDQ